MRMFKFNLSWLTLFLVPIATSFKKNKALDKMIE